MGKLVIETPDGRRSVTLDGSDLRIGRLSYNDIVLPYAQISRQHARVHHTQGAWWITDLHSTNGLLFNGERMRERSLRPGDLIELAPGISLRYHGDSVTGLRETLTQQPTLVMRDQHVSLPAPHWGDHDGRRAGAAAARSDPAARTIPAPPTPHAPVAQEVPPAPPEPVRNSGRLPEPQHPARPPMRLPSRDSDAHVAQNERASGRHIQPRHSAPGHPLTGADRALDDPFRRSFPANARQRITYGPANQVLLHVCQTCGQLTIPDQPCCQSCGQRITSECVRCGTSLLPVQDRCPRCQAANPASIRRARHTSTPDK